MKSNSIDNVCPVKKLHIQFLDRQLISRWLTNLYGTSERLGARMGQEMFVQMFFPTKDFLAQPTSPSIVVR